MPVSRPYARGPRRPHAGWGSEWGEQAGGCPEGVSPFAATVGAWQRLTTPAAVLRSGVVRSRVTTVAGRARPGIIST